jgi:hypothetical protein
MVVAAAMEAHPRKASVLSLPQLLSPLVRIAPSTAEMETVAGPHGKTLDGR